MSICQLFWREVGNGDFTEELLNSYHFPNLDRFVNSMRMRWAGLVTKIENS